ncbi:MAG: hypothetical protein DRH32_04330 [Deltaproteobacteria bacterium]|nr:MAG: hypothetical protein DRH32_04330 [Deltaproteobacteria bacterium]
MALFQAVEPYLAQKHKGYSEITTSYKKHYIVNIVLDTMIMCTLTCRSNANMLCILSVQGLRRVS